MEQKTIRLPVQDMEKMLSFYQDVMGMHTLRANDRLAECELRNLRLILYCQKTAPDAETPFFNLAGRTKGNSEIAIHFPTYQEVDQAFDRVTKLGAVPVFPPNSLPWGQRASYVADPEANLIEISSGAFL